MHVVIFAVCAQGLRPSVSGMDENEMLDLSQKCWVNTPERRPSAQEVVDMLTEGCHLPPMKISF